MKISLNWMKDYVEFDGSVQDLVERLTMSGIEAEKVESVKTPKGNDTVVEFEITPNRPDCLSHWGLAREIAARFHVSLRLPKVQSGELSCRRCDIKILAPEACRRYVGTVVEGVAVADSSKPRRTRQSRFEELISLGSRLINNVVDATNFCLFETGQPLHAFDLDKLIGGRVEVRFARPGERLTTLDGVDRELDPSVLVIADAERPVALAGIMGGANSEVGPDTKNILLESAWFDPVLIRRTSRKLGLASDSSYRFERGVSYENVLTASRRALALIVESAGGTVTRFADVKAGKRPARARALRLDLSRMNHFLGAKISAAQIRRIFTALGFEVFVGGKGLLTVRPPDFRPDIRRVEDLYEEVARVVGYDNLPSSFPVIPMTGMVSSDRRAKRQRLADYLLSQGFNETVSYSLLGQDQVEAAACGDLPQVQVRNPLSQEHNVMRPHLLPSLLSIAITNINRGQKDLALFETGKIYPPGGEQEAMGMILTGCLRRDWRRPDDWPFDFFDLKGSIEKMLAQFGVGGLTVSVSQDPWLESGQRADLMAGSQKIGSLGKVADAVLDRFGIKQAGVFFAQVDLEAVYAIPLSATRYAPVCGFPSVIRDISLAVDKKVSLGEIFTIVRETGTALLQTIDFKEEYLGDKTPEGQRGLVFSVIYKSPERTLTEEEVQAIHDTMCRQICDRLGAVIR